MIADPSKAQLGVIQSEFVNFTNRQGLKLAAYVDFMGERLEQRPWVVVAMDHHGAGR